MSADQHQAAAVAVEAIGTSAQDDVGIAMRLHDLQTWISQANCLLDRLRFAARFDEALEQKLLQRGVMFNSACWDVEQSDGLDTLNAEIAWRLERVERVIERKKEGAAK